MEFFAICFLTACSTTTVEVNKEAGYLNAGDAQYTASLGDNETSAIWAKYLDAHNNRDMETIMSMESDSIKIWPPDGRFIEGKEAHSAVLTDWFAAASPKWEEYFSLPAKVNWENQPGQWVLSGSVVTETIEGEEVQQNHLIDAYIEDGLIQSFWVYSRVLVPAK